MTLYCIYITLALVCVTFWRMAVKILVILATFLLLTGIIAVIQEMHHIR
jgi:hypothetical protein